MGDTWVIDELRRVLALLAAPGDEQLAYLRRLGPVSVDELGLEFDDIARAARAALREHEVATALAALDDELSRMSGQENAALWTDQGVATSPAWATVRDLASRALRLLDRPAE